MNTEANSELDNAKCNETEKCNNDALSSVESWQVELANETGNDSLDARKDGVVEKFCCPEDNDWETKGLSKSKLKKLRKIQRWEETKGMKRKKEKEKKRAKRQAIRDAGVEIQKKKKTSMGSDGASRIRVALDLSFNTLMTEKDQRKVVKQVLRSYSMNRQSPHPLQLHLTNFDDSNKDLFGKYSTGYKSWDIYLAEENHVDKFDKKELVYLTSDSSNILTELDENKVYVIGGIVDHNSHKIVAFVFAFDLPPTSLRDIGIHCGMVVCADFVQSYQQKGLCFDLAKNAEIGHARLPIDEYIKLEGRKVLPINHVFEILLHFVEFADWEKAFYHVIPKRKGLTSHQKESRDPTGS